MGPMAGSAQLRYDQRQGERSGDARPGAGASRGHADRIERG